MIKQNILCFCLCPLPLVLSLAITEKCLSVFFTPLSAIPTDWYAPPDLLQDALPALLASPPMTDAPIP